MTSNETQSEHRLRVFRWPTRDARDADHLAIIALVGGAAGAYLLQNIAAEVKPWWLAACVLGVVAAPLLWLRVPLAKWVAVAANCCLGIVLIIRNHGGGMSLKGYAMIIAVTLLAVWYARIDYLVRFEEVD